MIIQLWCQLEIDHVLWYNKLWGETFINFLFCFVSSWQLYYIGIAISATQYLDFQIPFDLWLPRNVNTIYTHKFYEIEYQTK